MMFYVYTIFNKINGKIYVGETNDWKARWSKHISVAYSHKIKGYAIHAAIFKYGIESFEFSVLQELPTKQDVRNSEIYWIKYFQSKNRSFGYNLTYGGDGGLGTIHTEETKSSISKSHIGMKHTEKSKAKMSISQKLVAPFKQRRFIGPLMKRKPISQKQKELLSKIKTGLKFTDEHKINMSKATVLTNKLRKEQGIKHPSLGIKLPQVQGENNFNAKLKEWQVLEIRNKFNSGSYSMRLLAREYNISRAVIKSIIKRITWKHI